MTVFFTKAGLFEEKWNGKRKQHVRRRVKKLTVWTHLRDACEIEEGVTLLDIFRTVSQYKMLRLFVAQYSWCKAIDDFHAQAEEPNYDEADEDPDEKMDALEIYWATDYGTDEGKPYMNCDPAFHGIGKARGKYAEDAPPDFQMRWSVSMSPMYSIAHLPVVLNPHVELYDYEPLKKKPLAKGESIKPFFTATKVFTLQDVLDAIYWEISFHGSPQGKSEFKDELNARMEDIKSGLVEGIPAEEVFGNLPKPEGVEGRGEGMKIVFHPDLLRQLGLDPDDFKKPEESD